MTWKRAIVVGLCAVLVGLQGCTRNEITQVDPSAKSEQVDFLQGPGIGAKGMVAGRYLIQLQPDADDAKGICSALAAKYGIAPGLVYDGVVAGFSASLTGGQLADLTQEPQVLRIEQDRILTIQKQDFPTGLDRIDVELNATADIDLVPGAPDVDVAILGTGIDQNHPDLNVVDGVRILGGVVDPNYDDDNGHDTLVAGIVGAQDNDFGVVGVVPGARLWAVKVLYASGSGYLSDIIAGLNWVTARAADIEIVNMSFTGLGWSGIYHDAVANCVAAGVVVVAAAGNNTQDVYGADRTIGTFDDYIPACFPEAATISALADYDGLPAGRADSTFAGMDDGFANFSNYSTAVHPANPVTAPGAAIDLMLPGVGIRSTTYLGGYGLGTGTSMAAAHASGLVALHILDNGAPVDAAGVYALRQALIDAAVDQTSLQGLAVPNDRDANHEPIGWAVPVAPFADLAVVDFHGTAQVIQGDPVTLTVTIANRGTSAHATAFDVAITEVLTGRELGRRTIPGMGAGATLTGSLTMTTPAGTPPDIYHPVVEILAVEPVAFNNTATMDVQVLAATPTGNVAVTVTPGTLNAPWSLSGPGGFFLASSGDTLLTKLELGDYTITWSAVPFYFTPPAETLTLTEGEILIFNGVYTLIPHGNISIDPEPNTLNAGWQLRGPDGYYLAGYGDRLLTGVAVGQYTITWILETGWVTPDPETLTLVEEDTIIFRGEYTESTTFPNGYMTLYWDDGGSWVPCTTASFLQHKTAYIVYVHPVIPTVLGFECGIDISRPAKDSQVVNSSISATYPTSAVDVGMSTPPSYNYIVGFASAMPVTGDAFILATLDVFVLDNGQLDFTVRASNPSSDGGDLPNILAEDFSFFNVGLGMELGSPTMVLNPVGECPVVPVE